MRNLGFLLGITGVVGTVVSLFRAQAWWIRIFDFPRLQIAVVCLLAMASYVLLSFWKICGLFDHLLVAAVALSFTYQAHHIFPYTPFASPQVQNAETSISPASLRLLISKVLMTNRGADRFRQIIKNSDPDVILAVEPDDWWEEQLRSSESRYPFTMHNR
jgi:endonuclease/exonuclease/phosphatase (EEP) superfamily protein YafD